MTLKQIFQLKNIPCVYLHDILKKLLAKISLDASFMCLSQFVAFRGTFNGLGCWTQRRSLLSRIQLRFLHQSLQTGTNESVLQFEVCFCGLLASTVKLIQIVYLTVLKILPKLHKSSSYVSILMTLKQSFHLERRPCMYLHDILKRLLAKAGLVPYLCVCLDLLHFVSL